MNIKITRRRVPVISRNGRIYNAGGTVYESSPGGFTPTPGEASYWQRDPATGILSPVTANDSINIPADGIYKHDGNEIFIRALKSGSAGNSGELLVSEGASSAPNWYTKDYVLTGRVKKLFSQTADKTITNTTTETSIFGSGIGSINIAAGSLSTASTVRTDVLGQISTASGEGERITIKVKISGSAVITIAGDLPSGFSGYSFRLELFKTCRSIGSSGTLKIWGNIFIEARSAGYALMIPLHLSGTTTVNTQNQITYDITATWESAKTGNILSTYISTIEQL